MDDANVEMAMLESMTSVVNAHKIVHTINYQVFVSVILDFNWIPTVVFQNVINMKLYKMADAFAEKAIRKITSINANKFVQITK